MSLFVKLATSALTDPKILMAGPEGFTLWAKGLLWSKEHLTDGFVPSAVLPILTIGIQDAQSVIRLLIEVGLWVEVEGGYTVGEERWSRHQQTSDQVEAKRESGRERQRRHRERLTRDTSDKPENRNAVSNALVTRAEPEPEPEPEPITPVSPPRGSAEESPPDLRLVVPEAQSAPSPSKPEPPWWIDPPDMAEPCRIALAEIAGVARFRKYLIENESRSRTGIENLWAKARDAGMTAEHFGQAAESFRSYYSNNRKHSDGVATFRDWINRDLERASSVKPRARNGPPGLDIYAQAYNSFGEEAAR